MFDFFLGGGQNKFGGGPPGPRVCRCRKHATIPAGDVLLVTAAAVDDDDDGGAGGDLQPTLNGHSAHVATVQQTRLFPHNQPDTDRQAGT